MRKLLLLSNSTLHRKKLHPHICESYEDFFKVLSQYLLVCVVSALNVAEVLIIQEKIYTKATQKTPMNEIQII